MGKVHVLIVEDNSADVELIRMALVASGFDFDLTLIGDGALAMDYVAASKCAVPDVILLDVNLPKAGGAEVLNAIRANAAYIAVPVVALSSSSAMRDMERIKSLGADCYIVKPSDLDELLKIGFAIRECMDDKRRSFETAAQ